MAFTSETSVSAWSAQTTIDSVLTQGDMAPLVPVLQAFPRGTTVWFQTTFYDQYGNVTQPNSATINLTFLNPNGSVGNVQLSMVAPVSPATVWTAQWDTRNIGAGPVEGSVYSQGAVPPDDPPVAVEDFNFVLTANSANLVDF